MQKLAKLAKFGKIAGPGFIVLDGALRTHKVANMYQENNAQWKREAVIQAGGFAAGILAIKVCLKPVCIIPTIRQSKFTPCNTSALI